MDIKVNQRPVQIPQDGTLDELLCSQGFTPPYAVAINTRFIPRSAYAQTHLQAGDRVEVITPVTGG
ncbi:MAG: sulfur carrier protein ThiS [Curvibacter lanceolatus]|jgi:sulfur carrier protein|uniref:sulfur carrier protein ThiS n=1 Tax=Curvibacter lanceolatus TaxID=86182 RepID=UPI000369CDB8|nr:sulfur carrier protein ThiS [Curvibacter lanceolatus]MBV5294684.1 sulfur carrier protein ThiS [Curvibacter lanceolatus]